VPFSRVRPPERFSTDPEEIPMARPQKAPAPEPAPDLAPELAAGDPTFRLDRPQSVFLGEAGGVAAFCASYRNPSVDKVSKKKVPGLCGTRLAADAPVMLRALLAMASDLQIKFLVASQPAATKDMLERADWLIRELEAAIAYYLDDGVVTEDDAKLAAVQAEYADPESIDKKGLALKAWAALTGPFGEKLHGVGDFDRACIAEADKLGDELLAIPERSGPLSEEAKAALADRNRCLHAIARRVGEVQKASDFVFRHFPEIAAKAHSTWMRLRRAEARRLAVQKKTAPAAAPAAPTA